MPKKTANSSCEIPLTVGNKKDNRNEYYPFQDDFSWKGVKVLQYKDSGDDWAGIARQVLVGDSGETAKFHLRYFEISPGGNSSFETHKHEHVVICIRGSGRARVNKRKIDMKHLDVLYINPDTPH